MTAQVSHGVVWSGERPLWVRYDGISFRCGQVPMAGEGTTLCGLPGGEMVFRQTQLPFSRGEQIRAVLPQEIQDTLIHRLEMPIFSWVLEPGEEGFRIFYAAGEEKSIRAMAHRLVLAGLEDFKLVIAELAVLPLLKHAREIPWEGEALIIDASQNPVSLCHVRDDRLWNLRLVSPSASRLGEGAILEELSWLAGEMVQGSTEVLCLGRSEEFWQRFGEISGLKGVHRVTLKDLGEGIPGWEWARAAGLAFEASKGGDDFMMEFHLPGVGAGRWREMWTVWRFPVAVGVLLFLLWGGMQGVNLYHSRSAFYRDQGEVKRIFHESLPHVPVMVDARLQFRQVLARVSEGSGHFPSLGEWLAFIQLRVDRTTEVRWLNFHYEQGEVRLQGEVPSYDHLEKVRTALLGMEGVKDVVVEKAHIVGKTKKVQFSLRLS